MEASGMARRLTQEYLGLMGQRYQWAGRAERDIQGQASQIICGYTLR
jgi:hypothetical protein